MEQLPPDERPPAPPHGVLLTLAAVAETVALTCDSPKVRTTAVLSALFARYVMDLGH